MNRAVVMSVVGTSVATVAFAGVMMIDRAGDASAASGRDKILVVPASPSGAAGTQLTSQQAQAADPNGCVPGTWTASAGGMPIGRQSAHFAYRWEGGLVTPAEADKAARMYERLYDFYINQIRFIAPSCFKTNKTKVNINFIPNVGPSAGADDNGNPAMWVSPPILDQLDTLAHELTHAFQAGSLGFDGSPYTNWFWESHAEYMTAQLPELHSTFTGCTKNTVMYPHLAYGFMSEQYCGWQFLEYLKDRYGYKAVNDLWSKSPRPGTPGAETADVLSTLLTTRNWTVAQMNTFFGEWAMHNVNWDYINPDGTDQGKAMRAEYGSNDDNATSNHLRTATLDPVSLGARIFAIQPAQAPQRLGYNLVRVFPDAGATSIKITFKGVMQSSPATASFPGLRDEPSTVEEPSSGWRWGIVAIGANGVSRYSPVFSSSNGTTSFPVQGNDKSVWLVVLGAPTKIQKLIEYQAYYSVYRFPWMVRFVNAMPSGYQPNAPKPTASGHRHPNGGGWVADGATVASSAYVGPYARVLGGTVSGNARIDDHAIVAGGSVSENARVGGLALIDEGSVIKGNAEIATVYVGVRAATVSGTAKNLGDMNYYGFSMNRGTFYGNFEEASQLTDPAAGANLTTAVPEVTAKPIYTW